jgi:hypothetical protein
MSRVPQPIPRWDLQLSHSTVADLTSSPYLWMVNICRHTCAFCQALTPAWRALAHELRQEAHVAHWDAELLGRPPTVLGEVNATPTIRAYVPRPNGSLRQVDYLGDRSKKDMLQFAYALMPSYVHVVDDEEAWQDLSSRALDQRLPRLVLFVHRPAFASPPPILKAVSAKFREQALVLEVRVHPTVPGTAGFVRGLLPHATFPTACLYSADGAGHECLERAPSFARLSAALEAHVAATTGEPSSESDGGSDRQEGAGSVGKDGHKEEL